MKETFDAIHRVFMTERISTIKLGESLLHLVPEPLVVLEVGLQSFAHNLFRFASSCGREALQFCFKLRGEGNLMIVVYPMSPMRTDPQIRLNAF